jgi:hypothetical protein
MGRVDGRQMRDVLVPMIIRATAHVDLVNVADRMLEERAFETRRGTIPCSAAATIRSVTRRW